MNPEPFRTKDSNGGQGDQEGVRLTRGHSIQVAVDVASGEMLYASPPVLLERLGVSA